MAEYLEYKQINQSIKQKTNYFKLTCGTPLLLNPLVVESESKHQWTNVLHESIESLNEEKKSLGNI